MTFLAGFCLGIIVATIILSYSHSSVIDRYVKAGFIRDSDYKLYQVKEFPQ